MEHEENRLHRHRTLESMHEYMAMQRTSLQELEYSQISPAVIEALISINTRLQQHDADGVHYLPLVSSTMSQAWGVVWDWHGRKLL